MACYRLLMQYGDMPLFVAGFLDGPFVWALLSLLCLIGVPVAIIVVIVLLLRKKTPQVAPSSGIPPAPGFTNSPVRVRSSAPSPKVQSGISWPRGRSSRMTTIGRKACPAGKRSPIIPLGANFHIFTP